MVISHVCYACSCEFMYVHVGSDMVVMYGHVWSYFVMYGNILSCMVIFCYVWSCMVLYGHVCGINRIWRK